MTVTRTHFTFRVSKRKPRTCRGFQYPNKGETPRPASESPSSRYEPMRASTLPT